MKKLLVTTLGLFLSLTVAATAQSHHSNKPSTQTQNGLPVHNGNWWNTRNPYFRDGFVTGYKSGGMHTAGHPIELNNYPASQLIDGLDHFYKDFRNVNIVVDDAFLYIIDQIHGVPDARLNDELLKMRAASAPPPDTQE